MSFVWLPPAIASALTYIPALAPLIMIGTSLILFGELIIFLIKEVPNLLKLALKIFNPELFIRDLLFAIFKSIYMILDTIGDIVTGIIEKIFNTIFGQENGGFFGQGKQKDPKTGKYFSPKNKVCKKPPSIIKYIILILCPPFYVFLNKGLNGWFYILIDILLTMSFYFPGLIYAVITCPICGFSVN